MTFRDETHFRIYNGTDGALLAEEPVSSCTWIENPVIADVDGNGQADIVIGANSNCFGGPQRGIYTFCDANSQWPVTRPIWNQFNYSITNVTVQGLIPANVLTNWLPPASHNSFRANPALSSVPRDRADLTASVLVLPCQGTLNVLVRIGNGGVVSAPPNVPVLPMVLMPGGHPISYNVARHPSSCGATYFLQLAQIDPFASHGVAFSSGLRVTFGGQ